MAKKQAKSDRTSRRASDELVDRAYELFEEFRQAYVAEWQRQDFNERLYRGDHWSDVSEADAMEPRPVTPIINSTVENILADLMDRSPIAVVRPENPVDREVADVVNALIRQNHDAQNFRKEYRRLCHDLLVSGWCAQETGYDIHAYHNIGMGFIRYVDCRGIMFDPQIEDIQDGRAVFKFAPVTVTKLEQIYPEYAGRFRKDSYSLAQHNDPVLHFDQDKSVILLEYWWREYDTEAECWRVHMAKIAGRQLLADSRKVKSDGYFSAGEYPFKVTTFFRRKGSPLGWGIADVFNKMQLYSDKLDQIVLKNALMASHNKLLVTESAGFDIEDLQDWSKEVHKGESLNGVTWFSNAPLPPYIVGLSAVMRESLREESGANDFSRGGVAGGVTAAGAIDMLQELSSKRARMLSEQLHESFRESVRYEIMFEHEFNVVPREVLVMVDGEQVPRTFESAMMERSAGGVAMPIEFYISIKVEQESRWQARAHNDFILHLASIGAFTPQQAVEFMVFDGKDEILGKLRRQVAPEQAQLEQAQLEQAAAEQQFSGIPSPEAALGQTPQSASALLQLEPALSQSPEAASTQEWLEQTLASLPPEQAREVAQLIKQLEPKV